MLSFLRVCYVCINILWFHCFSPPLRGWRRTPEYLFLPSFFHVNVSSEEESERTDSRRVYVRTRTCVYTPHSRLVPLTPGKPTSVVRILCTPEPPNPIPSLFCDFGLRLNSSGSLYAQRGARNRPRIKGIDGGGVPPHNPRGDGTRGQSPVRDFLLTPASPKPPNMPIPGPLRRRRRHDRRSPRSLGHPPPTSTP